MSDSPILEAKVVLEVCPPSLSDRDKAYAILKQSFASYNSFHAISVPDLQDDAEFQRVRARVPNEEFAIWLRDQIGKPLSLYKVSVHCDKAEFSAWLDEAKALGCRDVFLVGGDASDKTYKDGAIALDQASLMARDRGFHCGGIIIPTRRQHFVARPASVDETTRMLNKIQTLGFSFFTTQILYESEWMACLLLDTMRMLEKEEMPKIFLTFSPLVCAEDISFAKKTLGVFIPRDVERMLKGARSMREASISCLIEVWERIAEFANEIGFPQEKLAVNVEYLDSRNPRNVDAAFELAEEFGRIFKKRRKRSKSSS